MKKLYKVTMGQKCSTTDATKSSGEWWMLANSIAEAVRKAEARDKRDAGAEKAIAVELIVTEKIGLIV
jgi:hypothetical protein